MGKLADRIDKMHDCIIEDIDCRDFIYDIFENIDKLYNICANIYKYKVTDNIYKLRDTGLPDYNSYIIRLPGGDYVKFLNELGEIFLSFNIDDDGWDISDRNLKDLVVPPEKIYAMYILLKRAYAIIEKGFDDMLRKKETERWLERKIGI